MQKQPPEVFHRKRKTLCWSAFLIKLLKTPTQVLPCEICNFFKNAYFEEHLPKTDSIYEIDCCSMLVSDIIFCIVSH